MVKRKKRSNEKNEENQSAYNEVSDTDFETKKKNETTNEEKRRRMKKKKRFFHLARGLELRIPLDQHSHAQYSLCSFFKDATNTLGENLSLKQITLFRKTPWGHLLKAPEIQFSTKFVHMLLLRLVRNRPHDELWFYVGGRSLKFTCADFVRITGLSPGSEKPLFTTNEDGDYVPWLATRTACG